MHANASSLTVFSIFFLFLFLSLQMQSTSSSLQNGIHATSTRKYMPLSPGTKWKIVLGSALLLASLCFGHAADNNDFCLSDIAGRLRRREGVDEFFLKIKDAKDKDEKYCAHSSTCDGGGEGNTTENASQKNITLCGEACEVEAGNLPIAFDDFQFYAGFAVENGQLLSSLIARLPFNGIWQNGGGSLANASCSGGTVPNFFSGGNALFVTRSRSAAQTENIFAVGGCLGNGFFSGSECFYHYAKSSTEKLIDPNDYCLTYSFVNPSSTFKPPWFTEPREWLHNISKFRGHAWLGGDCRRYCLNNDSSLASLENCTIPMNVSCPVFTNYSSDLWIRPYFDCELGHIWMVTYSVPVAVYYRDTVHYLGMTGVDIELENIKINQCENASAVRADEYNDVFADTHLCPDETTMCRPRNVTGSQLKLGLYDCVCKDGYYSEFGRNGSEVNGTALEEMVISYLSEINMSNCSSHETKDCSNFTHGEPCSSLADLLAHYECKPCPNRCRTCNSSEDDCRYRPNQPVLNILHTVNALAIVFISSLLIFVIWYRENSVIRSASWQFLVLILLGALMAYAGLIISSQPAMSICILSTWLMEIGFALSYGSILLKSWRIEKIFSNKAMSRPRNRKRLKNRDLGVYLIVLLALFVLFLTVATVTGLSSDKGLRSKEANVTQDGDNNGVRYFDTCVRGAFSFFFPAFHLIVLLPNCYLCFKLRRVLNDYAESREISVIVYFSFLIEVISFVTGQIQDFPPHYEYMIRSLTTMFEMTLMAGILFVPKVRKIKWPTKEEEETKKSMNTATLLRSPSASQLRRRGTVSLDLYHRDSLIDWREQFLAMENLPSPAPQVTAIRYQRRGSKEGPPGSAASGSRNSLYSRSGTEQTLRLGSTSSTESRSPFARTHRSHSLAIPGAKSLLSVDFKSGKPGSAGSAQYLPKSGGSIAEESRSLSPLSTKSSSSSESFTLPRSHSRESSPLRRRSASDAEEVVQFRTKETMVSAHEPAKRCSDVLERDDEECTSSKSSPLLPKIMIITPSYSSLTPSERQSSPLTSS